MLLPLPLSLGDWKSAFFYEDEKRGTALSSFLHYEISGEKTRALGLKKDWHRFCTGIQWHFTIPTKNCPQENKHNGDAHPNDQGMSYAMSARHKQISFNFLVWMTAQAIQHHLWVANLQRIYFFFNVIAMETGYIAGPDYIFTVHSLSFWFADVLQVQGRGKG